MLEFIDAIIKALPENLNAEVSEIKDDEIEIVKLKADELWSYVGSKPMAMVSAT